MKGNLGHPGVHMVSEPKEKEMVERHLVISSIC